MKNKKKPDGPTSKVQVKDKRCVTVEFTLEGIEAALIEAARQQASTMSSKPIPDDPIFVGVEMDMSADQDGEDVSLNSATVTFEFAT